MMPRQQPGTSRQDYATPRVFLDAVEREFGLMFWDLAADRSSRVHHNYFGPDHLITNQRDALARSWHDLPARWLWLNPPYSDIAPWAAKCALESKRGARIAFLVPASVGANWFWDSVAPFARVFSVGRMVFCTRDADGTEHPILDKSGRPAVYPKDLILAVYDPALSPGFERWQWKPKRALRAARSTSAVQL